MQTLASPYASKSLGKDTLFLSALSIHIVFASRAIIILGVTIVKWLAWHCFCGRKGKSFHGGSPRAPKKSPDAQAFLQASPPFLQDSSVQRGYCMARLGIESSTDLTSDGPWRWLACWPGTLLIQQRQWYQMSGVASVCCLAVIHSARACSLKAPCDNGTRYNICFNTMHKHRHEPSST